MAARITCGRLVSTETTTGSVTACAPGRVQLLRELMDAGLRGLEVHYRTFDADTTAAVGATADALGLLRTGGSDYHGDLGTYAEAHAGLWVPPAVGETLLERLEGRAG